ncbi:MAG: pantetheine-phosphate adenylyltransferase [Alphaproteobacteria bacterium]|nr:pantetheine-phosphate adenylyltransferase [Alphaproteobacteria bacterium]
MAKQRIGVYPGTFDPVTNGHMDIIARARRVVDHLIVGVARNAGKSPLFTLDERTKLLQGEIDHQKPLSGAGTIEIQSFSSLLMDFAVQNKACVIIRGLRAVSDFEYEFQMTGMNARLNTEIETVFLMASDRHQFISSRFVKEIGRLGGDVAPFVSPHIVKALKARFKREG